MYIKYLFIIIFLTCCNNLSVIKLPYFISPDFTPNWINNYSKNDSLHKIEDFSFINQNNKIIDNSYIKNKIVVSNFFFTTCPSICPNMTSNLKILQEKFNHTEEVIILSHSVTPWIDSVRKLKSYEKLYDINSKTWHLLTGDKNQIYNLARKSYFAEEELGLNKSSNEFLHTEMVFLIDKNSHIRGVYNGTIKLEIKRLLEDIAILKNNS